MWSVSLALTDVANEVDVKGVIGLYPVLMLHAEFLDEFELYDALDRRTCVSTQVTMMQVTKLRLVCFIQSLSRRTQTCSCTST